MATPSSIRRISRQTLTLIHKNLLVAWKKPFSTVLRTLVVPIALTLIFCFLKHISPPSVNIGPTGFSNETSPILSLGEAAKTASYTRLAFVTNGIEDPALDRLIQGVISGPGMSGIDTKTVNNTADLFDVCPQTIQGAGKCFAAVIFTSFNETNVDYSIAISEDVTTNYPTNYDNQQSLLSRYMLPVQWAVNSQLGNLSDDAKPSERMWSGFFNEDSSETTSYLDSAKQVFWLEIVKVFVAPLFICIFVGAAYHISTLVTSERQLAELMAAQRITSTSRILSTIISFIVMYSPGLIICSVLTTEILFTHASGGLFFILTVFCGCSVIVFSHFIASFFQKPSIAGMTCSILVVCLALITLATTLQEYPNPAQIRGLALFFPPAAWATLIRETSGSEISQSLPSDQQTNDTYTQTISQPLLIVFFVFQIIFYLAGTFLVERFMWGVRRQYTILSPSEKIALRVTNLSKTYALRRKWYWPFFRRMAAGPAVNNVDLEVDEGAITFLLGPNGGGKTSLLKCVTGMVSVDHGSEIALKAENATFGICPQNNIFWDALTVREHVQIWRKLRVAASGTQLNDDADVISECDLNDKIGAAAKTLSGGQKRKLQLAMAFAGGSKMVCIDEASSGLDPLSRRNIWDIIQKGRSRRTTLITTHFLDEADVLADHIVVLYRGHLVCQGSSTTLKGQHGDGYRVASIDSLEGNTLGWKFDTSIEATRKVIELESANEVCDVIYPTLEQVFLKVTSDSDSARHIGGDGLIGDEEAQTATNNKSDFLEEDTEDSSELNLDVARSIGMVRQVWVLFRKRYMLLRSSWFAYLVNLAIPIVVAAILFKYIQDWTTLGTCDMQRDALLSGASLADIPGYGSLAGDKVAALGPSSSFIGTTQNELLIASVSAILTNNGGGSNTPSAPLILNKTVKVADENGIVSAIKDSQGYIGFGLWSPKPETNTFLHTASPYVFGIGIQAFDYVTNRMSNMTTTRGLAKEVTTTAKTLSHVSVKHNWKTLPFQMLVIIAFVAAVSIAVIYPTYERKSNVRALHYSNGVSPSSLWLAYLLFDLQFILIEALVVWGLLFSGSNGSRIAYAPSHLFGTFILFGIASYLGTYLVSIIFSRGTFGIACGVHVALTLIYLAAYVMNQYLGPDYSRQDVYTSLQNGLGLISPGANLARAMWLSMNTFDSLCGKFGIDDVSNPIAYSRYGGVYFNLVLQILFLSCCIGIYEYGSAQWLRRRIPTLHHSGNIPLYTGKTMSTQDDEIPLTDLVAKHRSSGIRTTVDSQRNAILQISHVTKYFGKSTASKDISFDVRENETMALLGGNGAGKTTLFNMIRGELRPDEGDIRVSGISVMDQPRKARVHIGVCPQDDAVDNLTVRQTLEFYGSVKGLKNVHGNVKQVMNALKITRFEHHTHKLLSGGTKRKLTVAIALLGNPRLLLLDEPSTGQDAGAKRLLWRALKRVSKDRAILLTTHSMEEAEALASKAVIVSTRMLAVGSLSSLQELHGGLYKIRAVRSDSVIKSAAETQVRVTLGRWGIEVHNYWDSNGLVQFNVVYDRTTLGRIMVAMERLVGNSDIISGLRTDSSHRENEGIFTAYNITGPTMEEVFMNVVSSARGSGQSDSV